MAGQKECVREGAADCKLNRGKPEGILEEREMFHKTSSSKEVFCLTSLRSFLLLTGTG